MQLNSDLKEFVELLNSTGVEYLIVGAFAVAHYGYVRYTADLDILVRPNKSNASRILTALRFFGFESLGITDDDLTREGSIIQLGVSPNRIDLLTSISGVDFASSWQGRSAGTIGGIAVNYIGRSELIRNKKSTGRAKDLGDADELEKRGVKV